MPKMVLEKQQPVSRQQKERFRKRRVALFKKATTMLDDGTEIYIVLRRRHKYYTYTSNRNPAWPPPPQDLVSDYRSLCRFHFNVHTAPEFNSSLFSFVYRIV